jgi:hypothetical protein
MTIVNYRAITEKRIRRNYSAGEKLLLLRAVDQLKAQHKWSTHRTCVELKIQQKQYNEWSQKIQELMAKKPSAKSLHPGPIPFLAPVENQLIEWLFEQRQQGIGVSLRMMSDQAQDIMPSFASKSEHTCYVAISRMVKRHGFSLRRSTHESQKDPALVIDAAKDYISHMVPYMASPLSNKDYIINMDQTPIFFNPTRNTTLEKVGSSTVTTRTVKSQRLTLALTVTASGKLLKPFVVFAGSPNGKISREVRSYPDDFALFCLLVWRAIKKIIVRHVCRIVSAAAARTCPLRFCRRRCRAKKG